MSLTLTRRHNVDRFGYLIPHRYGNLPMVGAVATYRPGEGRFGGAVAVEERTTNILWVKWEQGGVNPSDGSLFSASNRIRTPLIAVSPSTTYTFSVQDTAYAILAVYEYQTDGTYIQRTVYSDQVFSLTTTANTGQIRVVAVRQGDEDLTPDVIEVFKPQGEAHPYATSFVAGTRAAGHLTYPAKDIINPEAGTIHLYLQAPVLDKDWFLWDTSVSRHHAFYRASTGNLEIFWNDSKRMSAALPQDKAWHTVTVVWQGEQTSLLIDGEDKATGTIPDGIQLADGELFTLGSRHNYVNQATKLIDELLILPYAASEEEILSWYESQGPLPPHPQALLQWDWQAVTRRHNVDRFGYLIPTKYGNVPIVGAVATYRPGEGRFGRGVVAVEEGTTNLWKANTQWIGYQLKTSQYDHPVPNVTLDNLGSHVTVSYEARVTSGPNVNMQVYVRSTDGTIHTYNKNPQLVEVGPEWTRVEQSVQIDNRSIDRYVWLARNPVGQVIDIRRFQVEAKPFATSFVDGTRPDGILAYPLALPENHTIACYRKSHTDEGYRHVVKRSDGKVFVDGVEDSEYDVGWIAGRNLLKNSDFSNGLTGWTVAVSSIVSIVDDNDFYKVCKVEASGGNQGIFGRPTTGALTDGETYTLSAMVKADGEMSIGVAIDGSGLSRGMTKTIGTSWEKVVFTKVSSGNNTQPRIYSNSAGTFYIAWVKVEKGSTATDWTPAPEDLGYSDGCLMFSNQTGLIDELLILPYAATEEEIKSWYEAKRPLPPHPQALLQWDWQAVRPAQRVKL